MLKYIGNFLPNFVRNVHLQNVFFNKNFVPTILPVRFVHKTGRNFMFNNE